MSVGSVPPPARPKRKRRTPPKVVGLDASEITPRVARVIAEEAFGENLRRWIAASGCKVTDVAALAGVKREDLYEAMDGTIHARAAWLALFPPPVELLYLAERAAAHGRELRLVDADGPRTAADVVRELAQAMTAASSAEADGWIDVDEAHRELAEWADVERLLHARRELLREAIRRRGLRVAPNGGT